MIQVSELAYFGSVEGELTVAIAVALRTHGIALPAPQREVRLLNNDTDASMRGATRP